MSNACIVLTTIGTQEDARKIAHALLERKLAACVNIVSQVESIYRWQGKVENSAEYLLVIKTRSDCFEFVRDAIKRWHPYDLPECVKVEITAGSLEYLNWITKNVDDPQILRFKEIAADITSKSKT